MNKRKIYWICQVAGWSFYGILQIFLYATAQAPDSIHLLGEFLQVLYYILSTHFIRSIIIRYRWLEYDFLSLIASVSVVILGFSLLNYGLLALYAFLTGELTSRDFMVSVMLLNIFGPMFVYFIWIMIYFTFHYFERYNKTLKYEAAAKEIELRNLRSQLNPHFIFNALNSIRALVDEDPVKSKNAITQLSNILRNSLIVDRQRLITFSEEIQTVRDYLELESIRYEERLKTEFIMDPRTSEYLIPPLMVQTLVENGIKHGISTLKGGGKISISSQIDDDHLLIQIRNAGQFVNGKSQNLKGFGLTNTQKRLELIYGAQASFRIFNETKRTVLTEIILPKML